jgi:hypothetical protein
MMKSASDIGTVELQHLVLLEGTLAELYRESREMVI